MGKKLNKLLWVSASVSIVSGLLTILSHFYPGMFRIMFAQQEITGGGTMSFVFNGFIFFLLLTGIFGIAAVYAFKTRKHR